MTKTTDILSYFFVVGLLLPTSSFANPLTRFFYKEPSPEVVSLAKKASMNDIGQRVFYRTEPELMDKVPFTEACNKHEGSTALGCFNGRKIFLFKIQEPQLEYMVTITAAHEMLHAVYENLNKDERKRIDELLFAVEAQIKDEDIRSKIEEYRKRDPSIVPSELHSIIGTEILNLPQELEMHYLKYFLNRKALVALSENYYKDFQARKDSLKVSDTELDNLKKDIELREKLLRTKQGHLAILKKQLEEEATNERVESFNKLAQQFNEDLKTYQDQIANYNNLAKERNSRAKANQKLYQSLDSKI